MGHVLTFILVLLSLPAFAATYYVRTDGNDSNAGTANTSGGAWLTVQKAANTVAAGDTVSVGAGTFSEAVTVATAGSSGSPVLFMAPVQARVNSWNLTGSYITVSNFYATSTSTAPTGILQTDTASHHCSFTNCVANPQQTQLLYGIALLGINNTASGCLVTNLLNATAGHIFGTNNLICTTELAYGQDVDVFRGWGFSNVYSGNFAHDFTDHPVSNLRHGDCFQTWGENGEYAQYLILENNTFSNGDLQVFYMDVWDGLTGQAHSINVQAARVHHVTFRNNKFIKINHMGQTAVAWTLVYNNVFYKCGITNGAADVTPPQTYNSAIDFKASIVGWSTNSECINNAFIECGYTNGSTSIGWYESEGSVVLTDPAYMVASNNYVCGTNFASKTGWPEATGKNGGDPGMASLSSYDFRLLAGSQLINAGKTISSFAVDINGTSRPQGAAWDIGPYEYVFPTAPVIVIGKSTLGKSFTSQ